jgi:hypothetical protein
MSVVEATAVEQLDGAVPTCSCSTPSSPAARSSPIAGQEAIAAARGNSPAGRIQGGADRIEATARALAVVQGRPSDSLRSNPQSADRRRRRRSTEHLGALACGDARHAEREPSLGDRRRHDERDR